MNTKNFTSLICLIPFVLCMLPTEASAARLIKAEISYEGGVVLECSTSDMGKPDPDEVWNYLKKLTFKPTAAFADLKIDPSAKQTVLAGAGPGVALEDSKVSVSIRYGGESTFRELTLTRVPKDKRGGEWTLDAAEIDRQFGTRSITRRDAARLKRPKTLKP